MEEQEGDEVRESSQEYREMDAEGRVSAGNVGDNEENVIKRNWLKVGSALNAPLNFFTEKAVKPIINHERFNGVADKDVQDYGAPFKKVGDAIKPYTDVLIEDSVMAATEIGKGISYAGRRFSDSILCVVNPEFKVTPTGPPSDNTSVAEQGDNRGGAEAGFLAGKMNETTADPVWTKPSPALKTVEMQETSDGTEKEDSVGDEKE